jgi:sigma-E factor negative regulatory protein RseC
MRETGIVVSAAGELVKVQMSRGERCEGCHACHAVGSSLMEVEAHNELGAKVGDVVEIYVEPAKLLGHSFILFIFPILMMIAGYFIVDYISGGSSTSSEGYGILGAFSFLLLSLLMIKLYDLFLGRDRRAPVRVTGFAGTTTDSEKLNQG